MSDFDRPDMPRDRGDDSDPHTTAVLPADDTRTVVLNKVSWGAVFAGAVLMLVVQIILNMLGVGIGAATLDPGSGDNPSASTLSMSAAIWFAVSGILAALFGGYAAGRLAGKPKRSTAAWHGLTAWAVSTLVIFYLLTSTVGGILGGTFRTLGDITGAIGSTARTTAQVASNQPGSGDAFSAIADALRGSAQGGSADAAIAAVRAALTGQTDQAREQAAQAIADSQNIPIDEARKRVAQYEQQYRQGAEQTRETATKVAGTTAKGTTVGTLAAAISLILGAIAGWFGGRWGAVEPMTMAMIATRVSGRRARLDADTVAMQRRPGLDRAP